ncbi:MAG: TrkA family potassium uptake protein [Candidatus Cloacimonadota bacterium]|nr:TrkA family potassium uptake protein [Candidatus Cloacimonadota bacterium]
MFIIIAGAGIIGSQIAKILVTNKHDVVVIDKNREVCENLYEETGAMTINGDATRIKTLIEAGIKKADTIVCLMRNDADNIACSLLSKSLGLEDVVVRLRQPQYEQAYKTAGVSNIVNTSAILLDRIIMEVEKPKVRKVFNIGAGRAGVYAIRIHPDALVVNKSVKEIAQDKKFPDECVFMGIYKKDKEDFFIPRGNHVLHEEDTVFIVSKSEFVKQASDFLTKQKKKKSKKNNKNTKY